MNTTEYARIVRHTRIDTLIRKFQSFSCDWLQRYVNRSDE